MKQHNISDSRDDELRISQAVAGNPLRIGRGFEALSFKDAQFDGLMDPLIMLDHYTMTHSTFGAHPHAGMSAVSILFEDCEGVFNNQDSLGNNIDLLPGDLYWLKAGSGVTHDEKPTEGSRIHGLQMFVDLPLKHKQDAPASLHVPAGEMPMMTGDGYRVRVVLGETNTIQGAVSPALPLTALDAYLQGGMYTHCADSGQSLLIYAVSGDLNINVNDRVMHLKQHRAIAIQVTTKSQQFCFSSDNDAHFVVLQGTPVNTAV